MNVSLDAILVLLVDGTIFSANPAACQMFGYSLEELKQHGQDLILDKSDPRLELLITNQAQDIGLFSKLRMRKKDHAQIEVELSSSWIDSENGATYLLAVIRDISPWVRAERLIEESEQRRRFALDSADIGDWDMDLLTNVTRRSLRHDQCFGYQKPLENWGYDTFLNHVHPDDRVRVDSNFQKALSGDGAYDVEFRVVWPDQTLHWLWSKGRFYFNDVGKPIRVSGIEVEISARKLAEQAMILSSIALDSASSGISIADAQAPDMPLIYVNAAFESITGYSTTEVLGLNCRFLNTNIRDENTLSFIKMALKEKREVKVEIQNHKKDGTIFWNELKISVVTDEHGKATHFIGVQNDITNRKLAEIELKRLNRALLMRSSFSETISHATNESDLLYKACQVAVDIGGYSMAWVGYARDDQHKTIEPVATVGSTADYINNTKLSWSENVPEGLGPAGRTIRSGMPVICEDFSKDSSFTPWLAIAQKFGLCAAFCLPLNNQINTFGILGLYLAEKRTIATEEIALLKALSNDLAFAIVALRTQKDQQRVQSALIKVASSVSASTDKTFFQQLMRNMAEALNADAAFVAELQPGKPLLAKAEMAKALCGRLSEELAELHDHFATSPAQELVPGEQIHVDWTPSAFLDLDLDDLDDHHSEVSGRHRLSQDHGFER